MPAAHAYKIEFDRRLAPRPRTQRAPHLSRRAARRKTALTARVAAIAIVPLAAVCVYVGLTAELAAQTYRLAADQQIQAQAVQTDDELRQQLAALQSVARLEAAAAKLGMREPAQVAVVSLPAARSKPTTTAFAARLASITRLLFAR